MLRLIKTFGFLSLFFSAVASAAMAPHETLRAASDQLFANFKAEQKQLKRDPVRIYALVDDSLGPYVDFPLVARLVLGKHWPTATAAQRERFTAEFHKMLVRFYTSAFVDDPRKLDDVLASSATAIRFMPADFNANGTRARVNAEVHLPDGRNVPVLFSMSMSEGSWKVYDVAVEGISLVTNYRTSFATEIQREGLDGLIDQIAAKNEQLLRTGNSAQ